MSTDWGASFVCHDDEPFREIGGKKVARIRIEFKMNRITPLTVYQTIARNRRDALAKVCFRDRLMPLNRFSSKIKVDTHSAHIKHY